MSSPLELIPGMTFCIISTDLYTENSVLQKSRITVILINIEANYLPVNFISTDTHSTSWAHVCVVVACFAFL